MEVYSSSTLKSLLTNPADSRWRLVWKPEAPVAPQLKCEQGLGSDTVGAGDQDRIAHRRQVKESGEGAELAQDRRAMG